MTEFKCRHCHKLLLKYEHNIVTGDNYPLIEEDVIFKKNQYSFKVEIRCPKCKKMNTLTKEEVEAVL